MRPGVRAALFGFLPAHPDWEIRWLVGQSGIMAETLTMMAVHAHPDDEASSTGGVLAAYSAQGIRTVVVTCTNGEFGDAPGGVKPGQNGHDEQEVASQRLAELRESCAILGVTNLELLGYHDSGMPDWDYKDRPDAFCNVPEADVAARISGLIDRYRPQVLISYDDQGPYQHPDHVHASRCAQAAVRGQRERGQALPERDARQRLAEDMGGAARTRRRGAGLRGHGLGKQRQALASEQRITTTVDIRQVLGRKRDALFAHGSQIVRIVVQQDPAGHRGTHLRPGALHPDRRHHRRSAARGRPVRGPAAVSELKGREAPRKRAENTDLVERSAAAYASAVPVIPQDDGFFGPASVTWRVSVDLSAPVAGLRSLLMQALHPLAMAGVDQHSDWRKDPVGRLAATSAYEATVTFGDRASARRVAQRVRAIHEHVRGVDTVTGQPYAAGDTGAAAVGHVALVDSGLPPATCSARR